MNSEHSNNLLRNLVFSFGNIVFFYIRIQYLFDVKRKTVHHVVLVDCSAKLFEKWR